MAERPIILIDLDGCVCQYDFPALIKRHFGLAIAQDWVWCHGLEESLGLPSTFIRNMFQIEAFAPPHFVPSALSSLVKLTEENDIDIYSNRLDFMSFEGLETWLYQYGIPYRRIIANGSLPSHVFAAVDDSPIKLLDLDSKVIVDKLILFQQPWNTRCHDLLGKFTWVENWEQVLKEIDG